MREAESFMDMDGGVEDIPYTVPDNPTTPVHAGGYSNGGSGPQRSNRAARFHASSKQC